MKHLIVKQSYPRRLNFIVARYGLCVIEESCWPWWKKCTISEEPTDPEHITCLSFISCVAKVCLLSIICNVTRGVCVIRLPISRYCENKHVIIIESGSLVIVTVYVIKQCYALFALPCFYQLVISQYKKCCGCTSDELLVRTQTEKQLFVTIYASDFPML